DGRQEGQGSDGTVSKGVRGQGSGVSQDSRTARAGLFPVFSDPWPLTPDPFRGAAMADLWRWTPTPEFWVLVGFHVFIAFMLALDLGVLRRRAHVVSLREAAAWSVVWVGLAATFAVGLWKLWPVLYPEAPRKEGAVKAVEFVTGYLVELSLSVDNLFV